MGKKIVLWLQKQSLWKTRRISQFFELLYLFKVCNFTNNSSISWKGDVIDITLFKDNILFLYPLKTSEIQRFSDAKAECKWECEKRKFTKHKSSHVKIANILQNPWKHLRSSYRESSKSIQLSCSTKVVFSSKKFCDWNNLTEWFCSYFLHLLLHFLFYWSIYI